MNVSQLEYAGPTTPTETRPASRWPTVIVALVMLGIFGYFAAQVMTSDRAHRRVSNLAAARTDLEMLGKALGQFQRDMGRLPTHQEGLKALVERPREAESWLGPYLKRRPPVDPWGNAYVYHANRPVGRKKYTILSRGPDGTEGTSDDVVDE